MRTRDHATLDRQAKSYRPAAILNYVTPCNEGRLEDADARGYASLAAEDEHLELSLKVDPGLTISEARFRATGSPALVAAGSVVTQLVRGRTLQAALSLTPEDLDCALGRLPELRRYATRMAIIALRQAAFGAWEKHHRVPPHRV
jgi:NifU-like protein involved in Fe-S cluster formation